MKRILTFYIISFFYFNAYSQIAINDDNSLADSSAMLDIKSTDSGVLFPRMTSTERNLISNVATGLLVYDTDEKAFMFYEGTAWKKVGDDLDSDPVNEIQTLTMDTKEISISGGNIVEFSPLGKSWEYPQGLDGTPFISLDTTSTYSVPSGKNLYVTSLFHYASDPNGNPLSYHAEIIFPDFNNFTQRIIADNETSYPILPSGTNIKCVCTGILLDNSSFITPLLFFWENGVSNSYTVPLNKKLILKSGYFGKTIFKINGIEVGFHQTNVTNILVLPGGAVLSNSTIYPADRLFTGYLID